MSILKNILGNFMPHMESRRSSATLAVINSELVHDVNGDESAVIHINGTATLKCTYVIEGSPDGLNYFPLICYPYSSVGGTIPQAGQPLYIEAVNAATVQRMLCCAVGGLHKVRIRLSAYTSGSALIRINSDACASISPYVKDQKTASLTTTATGAVGAAVIATLPSVTGLRHYIDRISVVRSATTALTASATPVLVTTTNMPGTPTLTFGSDAGGIGVDKEQVMDFGGAGLASSTIGTTTTIVCPAYTGVIWRINVAYRIGL